MDCVYWCSEKSRQTGKQADRRSTDDLMEEWADGKVDKKTDGQTKHMNRHRWRDE